MSWTREDREKLEKAVFRLGPRPVAREIGCNTRSLYRWTEEHVRPLPIYRPRIRSLFDTRDASDGKGRNRAP